MRMALVGLVASATLAYQTVAGSSPDVWDPSELRSGAESLFPLLQRHRRHAHCLIRPVAVFIHAFLAEYWVCTTFYLSRDLVAFAISMESITSR